MHAQQVLDAAVARFAPAPTLRLSGAAWQSLLEALSLNTAAASLPGTATVVAQAPGGTVQIEYAGRIASFPWPQRLAAGTTVHLARTRSASSPGGAPVAASAAGDSPRLSETAQTLARVLDGALREPPPPTPLRLELTAAHAAPERLAAALANAVSGSGAFFESHLADWVQGARSSESVLAEAQVRASTLASAGESAGDGALRQQIASLVTGEMAFRFAAWPGQHAVLVVGKEPEQASRSTDPKQVFFARLEMEFAELGPVQAVLHLSAQGIDVDLRASAHGTEQSLEANRGTLAQALASSGLRVGRIEVGGGI